MLPKLVFLRKKHIFSTLLVINFGFNLSFYMVIPYLSNYLVYSLCYSVSISSLILGVRNISQQGLFIIGGVLAENISYKSVIIIGSSIRVAGFLLLGYVTSEFWLFIASFLSGFAAALFTPALYAYISENTIPDRSSEYCFSYHSLAESAGMLLGPLCASTLMYLGYPNICKISAIIFIILVIIQIILLPEKQSRSDKENLNMILTSIKTVIYNKRFITLSLLMSGYFITFNQLYLLLPLSLKEAENEYFIAYIFIVYSLVTLAFQMKTTEVCERNLGRNHTLGYGLLIMGSSFLFLLAPIPIICSVILTTITMTFGNLMCFPVALSLVPELSQKENHAIYFSIFYVLTGLISAIANWIIGIVLESSQLLTVILIVFYTVICGVLSLKYKTEKNN